MDDQKQLLLLEYFISSENVFALIAPILKQSYFDPEYRKCVKFIIKYYQEYRSIPAVEQINVESKVKLQTHTLTKDRQDYCINELEKFCKTQAIMNAVLASAELLQNEDEDREDIQGAVSELVNKAVLVGVNRSVGVEIFRDAAAILERLGNNLYIPTGYTDFDTALGGGLKRQQLLLFSANSGGGKSMMMANFALTLVERGYTVLYISLELSVELVFARFMTMVTGIRTADELYANKDSVLDAVNEKLFNLEDGTGLFLDQMPAGTTPNQLRAYLHEFVAKNKKVPDCLVLDYLDCMESDAAVSADNVFEKDKRNSEGIRQICVDLNMIGMTASQQNRGGVDNAAPTQAVIAGGISKVNTTDDYVSIIWSEAMKAAGEIAFKFLKTRSSDGVGSVINMAFDRKFLRLRNKTNGDTSVIASAIQKKKSKIQTLVDEIRDDD